MLTDHCLYFELCEIDQYWASVPEENITQLNQYLLKAIHSGQLSGVMAVRVEVEVVWVKQNDQKEHQKCAE